MKIWNLAAVQDVRRAAREFFLLSFIASKIPSKLAIIPH